MEALLNREMITNKALCRALGVITFVTLISLGAFVRLPLPFTPVPLTLQTFFVLLSAAFLGANLGAATQVTYIMLGVLGLPVFTGAGAGLLYFAGPTSGYILGFIVASLFLGRALKYSGNNMAQITALFIAADLIILFCGVLWLKFIFGYAWLQLLAIGF
ncbi:MAG: biotin transporter BioY, partial [Candidatus Omnitrophica bacterium]|nr:biotin transporter BioY [Candidatus Omnitrophota bacterium]